MDVTSPSPFKVWAGQIRAPFLLLSVVLVLIGGAVAVSDGVFNGWRFGLSMVGVVLAHIAVNVFNELSDDRTGIDQQTERTPFSGGSGSLQAGHTGRRSAMAVAVGTSLVALAIGIYLAALSGWFLLGFIAVGALTALLYTGVLARWMLGELAAGIALGTFVVLGSYYAQASSLTPAVIWVSIPPGILTALLLLLNEFPDVEADRQGGRRHLVIVLGHRRAAVLYTAALACSYLLLVAGVALRWLPLTVLLALLTVPLAVKAAVGALRHGTDTQKLVGAMGANVGLVLGTDLLIAIGFFLA